jgi:hypothetical protein
MGHNSKSMKGRGILRIFYYRRKFIEIGHGSGELSGSMKLKFRVSPKLLDRIVINIIKTVC